MTIPPHQASRSSCPVACFRRRTPRYFSPGHPRSITSFGINTVLQTAHDEDADGCTARSGMRGSLANGVPEMLIVVVRCVLWSTGSFVRSLASVEDVSYVDRQDLSGRTLECGDQGILVAAILVAVDSVLVGRGGQQRRSVPRRDRHRRRGDTVAPPSLPLVPHRCDPPIVWPGFPTS